MSHLITLLIEDQMDCSIIDKSAQLHTLVDMFSGARVPLAMMNETIRKQSNEAFENLDSFHLTLQSMHYARTR
jgi:hypothetical protein